MRYPFLIVLILLCTACIKIGSDPQQVNYYFLESPANQDQIQYNNKLNIAIQLIDYPNYIDRPQIVTSDTKNTITINETEYWSGPLSDNIVQVVRESLSQMLPNSNITIMPWETTVQPTIKLKIVVDKFTGNLTQTTDVSIRWKIITPAGEVIHGDFAEHQPIGDTFNDFVAGLNNSLIHFSQEIAEKLNNQ